jgi:hypothetical protein
MIFGTFFNAFTREFWALQSEADMPFVIKNGDGNKFTGYRSFADALSALRLKERIFHFHNGKWGEIIFRRVVKHVC